MTYRGRPQEPRSRFDDQKSKFPDRAQEPKTRIQEQLKNRMDENLNKQRHQEHEEDWTVAKHSDSSEIRQLRTRMKLVMNKLSVTKRQKEQLSKQNKSLQEEVMTLQSNLRQMIPGFSNTSSNFPMQAELAVKLAQFYKYDCLDLFFDVLCPELNMKGILYFFSSCFGKLSAAISNYLSPAYSSLITVGCFTTLEGPIMNVLRKSFQANYKQISQHIFTNDMLIGIVNELQSNISLGNGSSETNQTLVSFLSKLGNLILECTISDPPLGLQIHTIGKKVLFNPLKHDPFDGFIKPKEECWVVIPEVKKGIDGSEMVSKSLVLQTSYDIIN